MNTMIDIETLGTRPGDIIVSIGAVEFDLTTGKLGREFYKVIHAGNAAQYGLKIEAGTVMWWLTQSEQARKSIAFGGLPLREVLEAFSAWAPKDMKPFGNGATFDLGLLRANYDAVGLPAPWHFSRERCFRTLKAAHADIAEDPREGTYHNALDDAKHQANHLIKIVRARRG